MGPSVSIWGHETVPELDSHDDCSTLKMYLSQSTVHFKTTTMVNFYVMCILPQQKNQIKKKIERDQDYTYVKVNMDQKGAQPSPTSVKTGLH